MKTMTYLVLDKSKWHAVFRASENLNPALAEEPKLLCDD